MLTYRIRRDNTMDTSNRVELLGYSINGNMITFTSVSNHHIKSGDTGKLVGYHRVMDYLNERNNEFTFIEDVTFDVGNNPREFTVEIGDEYPLEVENISIWGGGYIINFTRPHFIPDGETKSIIMRHYEGNSLVEDNITVRFSTNTAVSYDGELPNNYEFYRDDFRFREAYDLQVFAFSRGYSIDIPMGTFLAVNGRQEELLRDNYVEEEINKAIPDIINMEKNAYIPVIKVSDEEYVRVEEIEINLHFRERNGTDWLVVEKGFWNGYPAAEDGSPEVDKGYEEGTVEYQNSGEEQYRERQSDLLGFLGFSNSDVRYQKSALKKSFIRMLWYDSNRQGGNNLLCTSTVFMDSGTLYGKLVKHTDGVYRKPVYDNETGEYLEMRNVTGITVDTEPVYYTKNDGTDVGLLPNEDNTDDGSFDYSAYKRDDSIDNDFVEKRRLSSRITIKDKYNEKASSEGFYVYLFAQDDPHLQHKDLYMRVEFNHAGFGRTLPFMRPNHIDPSTLENGKSMRIEEIFQDKDFVDNEADEKIYGYPLDLFYLHSYIQFKYGYCKQLGQYVYYLAYDNNGDELSVDLENRKIILNLWEAKVR